MRLRPLVLLLPIGFLIAVVAVELGSRKSDLAVSSPAAGAVPGGVHGRLVVALVDSLRPQHLTNPVMMPELKQLAARPDGRRFFVRTCRANFTIPCLQTLFEGRQSPFGADIERFSTQRGSAGNLLGLAEGTGQAVHAVGDHVLKSLYGHHAARWLDTDGWSTDLAVRSSRVADEGIAALDDPRYRLHVIYFAETDTTAHYDKPGSPKYIRHFNTISRRLAELSHQLDWQRDSLVVLGDHGHDENGDHVRLSVAIFVGEVYRRFFEQVAVPETITQPDLLYLFGYPLSLPMPASYEGAFFSAHKAPPNQRIRHYEQLQRTVLQQRGFTGPTLEAQAARVQQHLAEKDTAALWTRLPLLIWYLGCLLWWHALGGKRELWLLLGFGLVGLLLTQVSSVRLGMVLAVPTAAVAVAPLWFAQARRMTAFALVMTVLAGLLSYFAAFWSELFHTHGPFRAAIPMFFVVIAGAGALLGLLRGGRGRLSHGAVAFGVFCLPSGVYYYQMGQNLLQPFIQMIGLWALLYFIFGQRRRLEILKEFARKCWRLPKVIFVLLAATPFLFWQEAGGWQWHLYGGYTLSTGWALVAYYGLGALLLSRLDNWPKRVLLAGLWVAAHWYCVQLTRLRIDDFVYSLVPFAILLGWLEVRAEWGALEERRPGREALAIFAAFLTAEWFVFRGYSFQRIDFAYSFDLFSWAANAQTLFLLAFVSGLFKYGFPAAVVLVYLRLRHGPRKVETATTGILFYTHLKVVLLAIQIFIGALRTDQKLYELAIVTFAFVFCMVCVVSSTYLVMWAIDKLVARVSDRARPALA